MKTRTRQQWKHELTTRKLLAAHPGGPCDRCQEHDAVVLVVIVTWKGEDVREDEIICYPLCQNCQDAVDDLDVLKKVRYKKDSV